MARRRRRGHRDGVRRILRKIPGWIGSAIIIGAVSHGAISTARDIASGADPTVIPSDLIFYYTGFDSRPGQGNKFNQAQLVGSLSILLGGLVAGKLVKWAGRSV